MNTAAIHYASLGSFHLLQRLNTLFATGPVRIAILFFMPLQPSYPVASLDSSWQYALNEAVARQLVFGRDIVFTFGPLASVYTGMYLPQTDWIMLVWERVDRSGAIPELCFFGIPKKTRFCPYIASSSR